jgi:hypothetical protein
VDVENSRCTDGRKRRDDPFDRDRIEPDDVERTMLEASMQPLNDDAVHESLSPKGTDNPWDRPGNATNRIEHGRRRDLPVLCEQGATSMEDQLELDPASVEPAHEEEQNERRTLPLRAVADHEHAHGSAPLRV